jgi:hypothetical protein
MGPAFRRQIVMFALIIALVMAALPAPASAGHSWGSYHWGRTGNPFTIMLGSNLSGDWPVHLSTASTDWTNWSDVLDTTIVGGGTNPKRCSPTSGRVEVCNAAYGRTGWLGLASIWASGDHITQGRAKMNDTYFNMSAYNTPAWRLFVMCQEVGHTFGLGHTDETHTNANQGTCMDYTNDPDGGAGGASETDPNNLYPNQHDYDQLSTIYGHTDSTTTVGTASGQTAGQSGVEIPDPVGAEQGGVSVFVTELGGNNRVITFVIWADANIIAAANANDNAPIANASDETVVEEGYPVDEGEHDHEAVVADGDGDGDGLIDDDEANIYGTDPFVFDTDADGIGDGAEVTVHGTNPLVFDTDADGIGDGDEVAASTDPLTAEAAVVASDGSFAEGSTVVTIDTVNLRATPSRQGDIIQELPAGTALTVSGPAEQAQGLNWIPVTTTEGVFGYVATDFIAPAGSGS